MTTLPGLAPQIHLLVGSLLPNCSDPVQQRSPPRMLAIFAYVRVATTSRAPANRHIPGWAGDVDIPGCPARFAAIPAFCCACAPPPAPPPTLSAKYNIRGECSCLGNNPAQADPLDSLSFPIISSNGALELGDLYVSLGWQNGRRALQLEVIMQRPYYFGYSTEFATLRVGAHSAPLADNSSTSSSDAGGCPSSNAFQVNHNPVFTRPGLAPQLKLDVSDLLPTCSDPAQQRAPPTMLALYVYVRVATTSRAPASRHIPGWAGDVAVPGCHGRRVAAVPVFCCTCSPRDNDHRRRSLVRALAP
ncbi:hypothetical protein PLESTF_001740500 [Pleodorina starrii]|nr:hypothetical protein PLESTF_001740500 [Pleodorina starrii]